MIPSVTIHNTQPTLSADPTALGAALKIIVAGGSHIGEDGMRRASGLSGYQWTRKREDTLALVELLEVPAQDE